MKLNSTAFLVIILLSLGVSPVFGAPYGYITSSSLGNYVYIVDTGINVVTGTAQVSNGPWGIAVSPNGQTVYITARDSDRLHVLDVLSMTTIASIPVGDSPLGVAVNPSGNAAYVANSLSQTISVIDTETYTVTATIPLTARPEGLIVNQTGDRLYITHPNDNTLSIINTNAFTSTQSIPLTGMQPIGLVLHPDGSRLYTADYGSGTVSVIDTTMNQVTTTITVGSGPANLTVLPNGSEIFVSNRSSGNVMIIDTASNVVTATIQLGSQPSDVSVQAASQPYGISVLPNGTRVYVADEANNAIDVIDVQSRTVIKTIPGISSPVSFGQFIGVDPMPSLSVILGGSGSGTVFSSPPGISCDIACTAQFLYGTTVTLTAEADIGSTFFGWTGACSGTNPECVVNINDDFMVNAGFNLINPPPELSADRGTIGTRLTITGLIFGSKKGKLLIGGFATKMAKYDWTPASITGAIKKPLPPKPYDVVVKLKEPKGMAPITLPGAFTMVVPEITSVLPATGGAGTIIEISGNYFGPKKGKVYLGTKSCKVLAWRMNGVTGESYIQFIVPKKMAPVAYDLTVANKVGRDTLAGGFTITP